MTISEMTNAELDRMIAEKRGWKEHQFNGKRFWCNEKGKPQESNNFTTDPRYAMELLKEMAEGHCFGGLVINIDKWGVDYKSGHNTYKRVNADTPERAIAEAWMEWAK